MDFANVEELTENWRPLSGPERARATQLLGAAGRWIRRKLPGIAADDPDAKLVSIEVVRTALDTADYAGHLSYSRTVGGISGSGTLANPGALLVFTDSHRELLGLPTSESPTMPLGSFGD